MPHTGVMIGYFLPEEIAEVVTSNLAQKVHSDSDLHLTILFLGDIEEQQIDHIREVVQNFALTFSSLDGTIGGSGRFPATESSEDRDVLVRLVDVPRLEKLREKLIEALRSVGIEPVLSHGYTPHITIAYVSPNFEDVNIHPNPVAFTIDRLVLASGSVREEFMLSGSETVKVDRSILDFYTDPFTSVNGYQDVSIFGKITKLDEEQRLVFGWASVIEAGGEVITDRQGDQFSTTELEKTAYDYVLESRVSGEMHLRQGPQPKKVGRMVESIIFTEEKQAALGIDLGFVGWWVGFKVNDEIVWKKIKDGKYKGFSIHGFGRRLEVKNE